MNSRTTDPKSTTTSTSITQTVRGSHEFQINGFSESKNIGIGRYIASDTFRVGGYEWAVYFYPEGKNVEDRGAYVSLFIALAGEGSDVRALFELKLVDQSGREQHKVHSHFGRNLDGGPYSLKYKGSMWGYKRYFRKTALEQSDYLKDDCLLISCSVGVVTSLTEGPKIYSIAVPPSNMAEHFGQFLESGKSADVSFEVDGEIFAAHKLILAARSPVFRAQLVGPMKVPNSQCIKVEDMEAPVFKHVLRDANTATDYMAREVRRFAQDIIFAMIHFIYWDSLPEVEELTGLSETRASTLMAQHLLVAADRYALERLKLLCEAKLCEGVSVDTLATTLALAEQHHCPQLKAVCLKFALLPKNLRAVMQSDGYEYLNASCPCVLTELLQYYARTKTHSPIACSHTDDALDGSEVDGRRVKQRM